jgi:hypothetical protein
VSISNFAKITPQITPNDFNEFLKQKVQKLAQVTGWILSFSVAVVLKFAAF